VKNLKSVLIFFLFAIIIGAVSWYGYDLIFKKGKPSAPTIIPAPAKPPTLSPEKREIISQLETHQVIIQDTGFSPQSLTIKLHDQVQWLNSKEEVCQIKGNNWGGVPIQSNRKFTQAFDKAGTFTYSCALDLENKGTIIVK